MLIPASHFLVQSLDAGVAPHDIVMETTTAPAGLPRLGAVPYESSTDRRRRRGGRR